MEITIISDFVCPYCYIADKHMEMAINSVDYSDEISIKHQSFQLYPELDHEKPVGLFDAMMRIKNLSYEHVEMLLSHIEEVAENIGLKYNFEDMKYTNTFKPHRVFQYINKIDKDKGNKYYRKIYKGFFTDGKVITDKDFLLKTATNLGFQEDEITNLIDDEDLYKDEVLQDIAKTVAIGVFSVPFITFDDKYGIYGGRSVELILDVMDKVHDGSIVNEERSYNNPIKFLNKLNIKEEN